ncbi:MAG: hypothetical protein EBU52_14215 [Cytophagia bacterium]|nr:hypothetical protein [Cytophagia bacterium]
MMKQLLALITLFTFTLIGCDDNEQSFSITPAIGFETTQTNVLESATAGTRIGLVSNVRLKEQVTVTIQLTNIGTVQYGVDYTTEPAAVDNVVTLTLDPEAATQGFFIYPATGNADARKVLFEITSVQGSGLKLAQASATSHTVSINKIQIDVNQLTIAQVRALYTGATLTISENKFIEGVVTSTNDNVTAKNVYIQDATAGIVLRFNANNTTDPGKVLPGEFIRIPLQGVTLSAFNGLLQLGDGTASLPHSKVIKQGTAALPAPKVITIAQLNTNEFQSQRVTIVGITVTTANGSKTYSGNNTITDGTGSSTLRVETYAPFSGTIVPTSTLTITGIASTFTTSQLVPMALTDIVPQ